MVRDGAEAEAKVAIVEVAQVNPKGGRDQISVLIVRKHCLWKCWCSDLLNTTQEGIIVAAIDNSE